MLAKPARTGIEVTEKWRFALDRYSETPKAKDARFPTVIKSPSKLR
ncbi:hypothetical protein OCH239_12545 [Roseivivax halodurans JCM 10272]|uniref:Uncharacterized protein n=1 Tax=Roseivivax halodurans JCM 10272 TaxID=1449350 RepID=X7EDR5_9RHOB|nr:hypothetical protein [Roseivivax halodurans]ETX13268.1 hypothetical protein OCH239_12545 [Roseivivax halodurans JCM 10272]